MDLTKSLTISTEANIPIFVVQMWRLWFGLTCPRSPRLKVAERHFSQIQVFCCQTVSSYPGCPLIFILSSRFLASTSYICPGQKLLSKEVPSAVASNLPGRNKCLAFSEAVRVPTHQFHCWSRRCHFAGLTRCYHHNTRLLIPLWSPLTASLVEHRGCLPFIFLIFIKQNT